MVYFVATPIGNLKDITLRALETLREADAIFCEDTRHTVKLLNAYEIKKPLFACHKFNETEAAEKILALSREDRTLNRRGSAVFRKKRSVRVHAAEARERKHVLGQKFPVGGDDYQIGRKRDQKLGKVLAAQRGGLEHRNPRLECGGFHRGRCQLHSASARAIRARHAADDVFARRDKRAQA